MDQIYDEIFTEINWKHPAIIRTFGFVAFMPIFWNCAARFEYYTHGLTNVFGCGNRYRATYVLAAIIFSGSAFRDLLFRLAMESQPSSKLLSSFWFVEYLSYALVICGGMLVLPSMWKLGITGTYLGDYFGILMESRVESYPFNVVDDPMYVGATIVFTGYSFMYKSWVGLGLTIWIFFWYKIALLFEGPFTAMIYKRAAMDKAKTA